MTKLPQFAIKPVSRQMGEVTDDTTPFDGNDGDGSLFLWKIYVVRERS
jgi:hypothetical protein